MRDRNPDEFAFGMMSSTTGKAGKHGAGANRPTAANLSHDAVKLLKTQDAGYLRTVGERVRRQMEKLEHEVRLQDGMREMLGGKGREQKEEREGDEEFEFDFEEEDMRKPRKMVFADDPLEQRSLQRQKVRDEEDEEEEDDDEEDDSFGQMKQRQKKSRKQLDAERQALVEARRMRKTKKRAAEARQNKLKALQKQYADITAASNELDWQRARMENSVGGTNKDGIKWKIRERKR